MTDAFHKCKDVNVIAVDWTRGASNAYIQAVANTRLVGRAVGLLIKKLVQEMAASVELVHIIGHSLGCWVAGYAGEHVKLILKQKVGRISCLDPAAPEFEEKPELVREDDSEAIFVDVIHTDTEGWVPYGGRLVPF